MLLVRDCEFVNSWCLCDWRYQHVFTCLQTAFVGFENSCDLMHFFFFTIYFFTFLQSLKSFFSHASSVALGMLMSVGRSTTLVQIEISQQLSAGLPWTLLQTFKVSRGRLLLTLEIPNFSSSATTRWTFLFFGEMSQQPLDKLPWNLVQTNFSSSVLTSNC